ncbi:MAG: cation:proton antiporter [Bacteroidales bacterium]|nr:cation:proton antiporter [Bacteroidales bacterium]
MEIYVIVISLGLLIFFSHAFNELFDKTKIPNVLLLLLIGVLLGPVGGIVSKDFFGQLGNVFTTITLIVILFESGSELKFSEIKKSVGAASLITVINFIFTMIIASVTANLLTQLDWLSSVFLGAIIGGTSSAVVIPMVKQLKMGEKSSAILFLESALSDVLCLIVGLAVLEGIKAGALNIGMVFSKMWKAFLFAALMGLAGGLIWSLIINLVRSIKNSMFTSLAFLFVIYGIVEMLEFNGGIAALSFGIFLGNSDSLNTNKSFKRVFRYTTSGFNINEKNFFSEIVFLMQTYFFVYVGISLQFGSLYLYGVGLLIVVLIILSRPLSIRLLTKKDISTAEVAIISVMTPKGLVAAVLASIPMQQGLPNGDIIMDLGYSVVLLSIVICSILVIILSKDPLIFKKMMKRKTMDVPQETNTTPEHG